MEQIVAIPQLAMFHAFKCKLHYEHSCDYRMNPRPHSTLAFIIDGSVKFVLADENFIINTGDIIFIPQDSKYISFWSEGVVYISLNFSFEPFLTAFAPQNFILQKVEDHCPGEFEITLKVFEDILEKYEHGGLNIFNAVAGFFELYREIVSHLLHADGSINEQSVLNAIGYLKANPEANCTVKELAVMCFLSESRFYTLFKRVTGYSPMEYKNVIKIRMAISMMCNNQISIAEISEKLGFSSASYFRKIFKKIIGKSPREYKRSLYI